MQIKNICCIGAGYVGGPTMAVIALKCPYINVTVVDSNSEKIKAWDGPLKNLPVYEPGLAEVIKEARGRNLFFSDDIAGNIEKSEMIFMAVNTPTKTQGEGAGMAVDLRYVEACAREIAKYSKSDKIVIEKSTLPVRTAEKIKEILQKNSTDIHFEVLSNPEVLAEGNSYSRIYLNQIGF
jgi:UDPglucose 6-dehydrogenase